MIKKIMALTKIFFVDYFKNLAIVDKKTNKLYTLDSGGNNYD